MKQPQTNEAIVLGGVSVDINAFIAYPTYEGWVEGYPNPTLNAQVIENAKERARTLTPYMGTPVHVVSPSYSRDDRTPRGSGPDDYVPLPGYCCIARSTRDGRELLVVWFCDNVPLQGSSLNEEISDVPWDKLALWPDRDDLF